jgi:hypothetical protein
MKNRNRKSLFTHQSILRGRYLKDDLSGGGGATPDAAPVTPNPGGGNPGGGGGPESSQNNTSQDFDATSFWGSQGSDDPSSSNPESVSNDDSGSDNIELRDSLTERLNALNFGEPVMTREIFDAASNGDFTGFQTALNGALGQAVKQALGLSVSVLKPFADQIMADVRNEISSTMGQRDDADQLTRDFPAAKDPKIRPVVDNLYRQALKNTKGDRSSAVQQVKEMMRLMSTSVADDLGLNVAPRSADDSGRPQTAVNWLDELTSS